MMACVCHRNFGYHSAYWLKTNRFDLIKTKTIIRHDNFPGDSALLLLNSNTEGFLIRLPFFSCWQSPIWSRYRVYNYAYGIANKDDEAAPFLIIHVTFNISAFVIYKRLISVAAAVVM